MKWVLQKINLSFWDWVMLVVASVPAFYLLGKPAIYIWDEAVYANASWDMAHGSSWLLPVHEDYNTKPPLVLWMQAISLKLFPWPEFAIRFPSALSVTGICLLLLIALKRWGFDQWSRVWVLICFIAHEGFIRQHIARTGDLDAVMTFFVVAYSLVFLDSLYFKKWNSKYLLCFFIPVILAFYAKSIAGWLMLGPIVLLWLLSPLQKVMWSKRFILASVLAAAICLLYYFIREWKQPGFFPLVWHSEYLRMAKNIMPWHEHPAAYYFSNFITLKTFTPWIYFLVLAILYFLFLKNRDEVKTQYLRWIILALGYMMVITIPAVKLEWYDAPAYPFFALILGAMVGEIIQRIPGQWKLVMMIPLLFIFYRKMVFIQNDIYPRHPFENEGAMLRKTPDKTGIKVFMPVEYPEHRLQLDFYKKVILKKEGIDVPIVDKMIDLHSDDRILIRSSEWVDSLNSHFKLDTLKIWGGLGYEMKLDSNFSR